MKDMTHDYPGREMRVWWYADDESNSVRQVHGFECPNTPNYWWCPEAGCSVSDKHHLFKTKEEALQSVMIKIKAKMLAMEQSLFRLQQEAKQ